MPEILLMKLLMRAMTPLKVEELLEGLIGEEVMLILFGGVWTWLLSADMAFVRSWMALMKSSPIRSIALSFEVEVVFALLHR